MFVYYKLIFIYWLLGSVPLSTLALEVYTMAGILILVGNRIKDIRKERELSQDQLGELCGFHFSYIGGVERGERNLSLENLAKIADALHVEIRDFFDFETVRGREKEHALNEVFSLLSKYDVPQIKMIRNIFLEILKTFNHKK